MEKKPISLGRRLLFWLACIATVIALLLVEENVRGKYVWLKERRKLEAAGEKLDLAQLVPPPVPDEKNFALMPLLQPIFDFVGSGNPLVWRDTNAIARLEAVSSTLEDRGRTNKVPEFGSLERGTFADLNQWAEFYRGNTNYPQASSNASAGDVVLTGLSKFDPEIEQMRDAAAKRPYSRFPIQYGHQPAWEILLPHLTRIKQFNRLLATRATAELAAGKSNEAFADLKLAMRFSESVKGEPLLIDHLVRLALVSINLQAVREGLLRHSWSDAQLVELENSLSTIDLLSEYSLAMRGERALSVGGLDYLRRQGPRGNPMNYMDTGGGANSAGSGLNLMPSGWYYQNMVNICRMHDKYTLASVNERDHRIYPDLSEAYIEKVMGLKRGPYTIFAKMLLPALEKAVQKTAPMQTYVDATRVGCAMERYRLAKGELPRTLDELVPNFIARIPTDIVDGQPLRFNRDSSTGPVIYSIGWNRVDDGGTIAYKKEGRKDRVDVSNGDWVWMIPVAEKLQTSNSKLQ